MNEEQQHKLDEFTSELTNSILFMVLVICVAGWWVFSIRKQQREQDECIDRGGYVEEIPDHQSFAESSWRCAMEDRD